MPHPLYSLRPILIVAFSLLATVVQAQLPQLDVTEGVAFAKTDRDQLIVSTGVATRIWKWTDQGLATISLKDERTGQEWVNTTPATSDWLIPGIAGDKNAKLVSLKANISTDQNFTSKHIQVIAEVAYPESSSTALWEIWAFPGSEGFRTQLWLKSDRSDIPTAVIAESPKISIQSGKNTNLQGTAIPSHFAQTVEHDKKVQIAIEGLDPAKTYAIALTWFDHNKQGRRQSIEISSIDGETKHQPIKALKLPIWDSHLPSPVTFKIPSAVNMDGTVKLSIIKNAQGSATVSEIWIYEQGLVNTPELEIPAKRLDEIQRGAPQGASVVGYLNTGANQIKRSATATSTASRVEYLPVHLPELRAAGYYNDTQRHHTAKTHLIRDERVTANDSIQWASLLCLENEHGGIAVVKESHKCVNQDGLNTGTFLPTENGLAVTGTGLSRKNLNNEFQWCWATWTILYPEANADSRELAIKRFDRARYPQTVELDLYTKANTWGSGGLPGINSTDMAHEKEVLKEIDSVADLGLDALQIDDGWQVGRMKGKKDKSREWNVRPDWYPNGWENVVTRAKQKDIKLGIWLAARAPLQALQQNYDQAHFSTWKLDFANLSTYPNVAAFLKKGRDFIEYTNHSIRINWDVTENAPRFGYYWARECGNIWLANRKPVSPATTNPIPYLQIREAMELSRYLNPQKFELAVQNYQTVSTHHSDAVQYSDTYSVAVALPGIPVFFQTTSLLKPEQRSEIKKFLEIYKSVRNELFHAFVFAIGDEPNNASWSGFQWYKPESKEGHLLIFRERLNTSKTYNMPLRFLTPGKRIKTTNLQTGVSNISKIDANNALMLVIDNPGDILFLSYLSE